MWKHGKTKQGKVRWYCKSCRKSGIKKRPDVTFKKWLVITKKWILDGRKLKHLANDNKVNLGYLQKRINKTLEVYRIGEHERKLSDNLPLILDGFWVVWKRLVVLIAHDTKNVIHWKFVNTENEDTWTSFLNELAGRPYGVVSDAQKGLLKAVRTHFGNIHHQRCIAHITRQSKLWLTKSPRTKAGTDLLLLVESIHKIKDITESERFIKIFGKWLEKYKNFLDEKSYRVGSRPWYTHKKLRATKSLITRALPNMFVYVSTMIPNTTNHLEGGINGPLSFVFKEHRGMSMEHKIQAVNLFLNSRVKRRKNQH